MIAASSCKKTTEMMSAFVAGQLSANEARAISEHIAACKTCRADEKRLRAVKGLIHDTVSANQSVPAFATRKGRWVEAALRDEETEPEAVASGGGNGWGARLGAAPWWMVSCALHVLVIALAGLVSMAIELPKGDDAVIMVTELQPRPVVNDEQEKPKQAESALESKQETPPTDPTSKEFLDIVVPPDILAKAELGDHFETINPDRPDTHSAYGNPDSRSFHSVSGSADAVGGGGTGGIGMEDMIGVGGAATRGTGGGFGGGNGTGTGTGNGAGTGSFGQRGGGGRKLMVKRHGGSPATENAVDKALQWLAYHQEADGHWDAMKYGCDGGNKKCDTFCTAISTLAFLGAGHSEKIGQYKDNVQRAVKWLISQQRPDGGILKPGENYDGYQCSTATMALAEAAGMARVKETHDAAQKAVNYCIDVHQNGEGSDKLAWRYYKKSGDQDMSVSGWFVMALKSAKVAGLHVDPASFEGAIKFLDKVQQKVNGADNSYGPVVGYGYTDPGLERRTSAIGNLCRQFMGWKKEDLQGSVEYFVTQGGVPGAKTDLYYWYYGTLCVFQQGGDVWKKWNEGMKQMLLPTQCVGGDEAGSWNPAGEFSQHWGRVGQTAISCLCLEVYYRYLQLTPDK